MADFAFNVNKHLAGYYATLPAANDALVLIPLQATGLGTDATLKDLDTLAQVLANATEQTAMGRKTLTSPTATVDDANDVVNIAASVSSVTWTAPSGNAVAKILVARDPDTTTGTDADLQLLWCWDIKDGSGNATTFTPDGTTNLTVNFNPAGLLRVA